MVTLCMYVCLPIVVLFGVNFYVYTYVYKSDSCISITINLDPLPTPHVLSRFRKEAIIHV